MSDYANPDAWGPPAQGRHRPLLEDLLVDGRFADADVLDGQRYYYRVGNTGWVDADGNPHTLIRYVPVNPRTRHG